MSFILSLPFFNNGRRQVGTIDVPVIITESTSDTLTITKQPVQQGAPITDHAYKEPTTLSMSTFFQDGFSRESIFNNAKVSAIYQKLIDLQNSRVPFDVTTPKRLYKNMLIASLGLTTDARTENCLAINFTFQEVIIVKVTTVTVARSKQTSPGTTGKTEPAGKKSSFLRGGVDAVRVLAGAGR